MRVSTCAPEKASNVLKLLLLSQQNILKDMKISPDGFMQAAFQLAHRRMQMKGDVTLPHTKVRVSVGCMFIYVWQLARLSIR